MPLLAGITGGLGAYAVDISGNLVANDIGYRGLAILAAFVAVLAAAVWLRREFKPGFALVVWVVRGCLLIAVAAVVTATLVNASHSGIAVLVAALATLAATVIPLNPADRLVLLGAVVLVGLGVVSVAEGISAEMTGGGRIFTITLGVFLMLFGVTAVMGGGTVVDDAKNVIRVVLDDEQVPVLHVLGVFFALMGVLAAAHGIVLLAVAMVLIAVGAVGMAVGRGRRRPVIVGLGAMVAGAAWMLVGIWVMVDGEVLLGAMAVGLGAAIVVAANTYLSGHGVWSRVRDWYAAGRADGRDV
ncbi:hypothetical protein [Actinophytocola glycyrrhizae]|uniref:Uncharacterized protein n=1 Tax=Actinophytocola glycyrrhizae TaxID=2044873 RepID=A0ABV9RXE1_9PSEU